MGIYGVMRYFLLMSVLALGGCVLPNMNSGVVGAVSSSSAKVEEEQKPKGEIPSRPLASPSPAVHAAPVVVAAPVVPAAPVLPAVHGVPAPQVVSAAPVMVSAPVVPAASVVPAAPVVNPSPSEVEAPSRSAVLSMSDDEIYTRLISGGIGACYIFEARPACPQCFCDAYFKSKIVAWSGKGWPVNPDSGNSTGCISSIQWGGYSSAMATQNLKANAVAQARDAFAHPSNPCGLKADLEAKAASADPLCPSSFKGHAFTDSYEYQGAFHVCDYAGSMSNQECTDVGAMQTAGAHGLWCQKFTDDSRSVLMSLVRKP